MKVIFTKDKNARLPYKRPEDVGFDIYTTLDKLILPPHAPTAVPTGLRSQFSEEYAVIIKERGSVGSKGIAVRCGVIDSGYRGEWFIVLQNVTDQPIELDTQKAIAQGVVIPNYVVECVEGEIEMNSDRGLGKLGSSGK